MENSMNENNNNLLIEGFLKGATANGGDKDFFLGYLNYFDGIAKEASEMINKAEEVSKDPEYRLKLASEILSRTNVKIAVAPTVPPEAAGASPEGLQGGLGAVFDSLGGFFGGDQQLGGRIAGGGGGALIGLLLSNILGTDPITGILISSILGLGGAGLGDALSSGKLKLPFGGDGGRPGSSADLPPIEAGQTPPLEGEPAAGPVAGGEPSIDTEQALANQQHNQQLRDATNFEVIGPAKANPQAPVINSQMLADFTDSSKAPNPGSVVAPSYVQDKPFNMNISNLQEVSKMQAAVPSGMQAPPPPPIRKPINLNPAGGTGSPTPAPANPPPMAGGAKPPQPIVPQMNVGQGKPNQNGIVDPKISQGQKALQTVTRIN